MHKNVDPRKRHSSFNIINPYNSPLEVSSKHNHSKALQQTLSLTKGNQHIDLDDENFLHRQLYSQFTQLLKKQKAESPLKKESNPPHSQEIPITETPKHSQHQDPLKANKFVKKLQTRVGLNLNRKEHGFNKQMSVFRKLDTYIDVSPLIKSLADPIRHEETIPKLKNETVTTLDESPRKFCHPSSLPTSVRTKPSQQSIYQLSPLRSELISKFQSVSNTPITIRNDKESLSEIPISAYTKKRNMSLPTIETIFQENEEKKASELLEKELADIELEKKTFQDKSGFHHILKGLKSTAQGGFPMLRPGETDDFTWERNLESNLIKEVFTRHKTIFEQAKEDHLEKIGIQKRAVRKSYVELSPTEHYTQFKNSSEKIIKMVGSESKKVYFEKHPEDRSPLKYESCRKQKKIDSLIKSSFKHQNEKNTLNQRLFSKHHTLPNITAAVDTNEALDKQKTIETKEFAFITGIGDLSRIQSEQSERSLTLDKAESALLAGKSPIEKLSVRGSISTKTRSEHKSLTMTPNPQHNRLRNLLDSSVETKDSARICGYSSKNPLQMKSPNDFAANDKYKAQATRSDSVYTEFSGSKPSVRSHRLMPLPQRQRQQSLPYVSKMHSLLEYAKVVNGEYATENKSLCKSITEVENYYDQKSRDLQHWSSITPADIFVKKEDMLFRKNVRKKRLNRLALSTLLD